MAYAKAATDINNQDRKGFQLLNFDIAAELTSLYSELNASKHEVSLHQKQLERAVGLTKVVKLCGCHN